MNPYVLNTDFHFRYLKLYLYTCLHDDLIQLPLTLNVSVKGDQKKKKKTRIFPYLVSDPKSQTAALYKHF